MGILSGKLAVISGAASGIGLASAKLFAAEGASLILVDIQPIPSSADSVTIAGDVSQERTAIEVSEAARSRLRSIDVLLNCAGTDLEAGIVATSVEQWDRIMDVNLKSVFLMCKHSVPLMSQAGASIVNVSSAAGISPIPNRPAYIASKGGIIALTKALALDLAPSVRVNCICPGAVDTPLLRSSADFQKFQDRIKSRYPLARIARSEEIASVAVFLASDAASYMTGATIPVDGGRSMA